MNICFFSNVTFWHGLNGGLEIHGRDLCRGLVSRDHTVTVIASKHPDGKVYEKINGINIYFLEDTVFGSQRCNWLKASQKKFLELHQINPFDIITSQQAVAPKILNTANGSQRLPLVILIQMHEGLMLLSEVSQIFHHKRGFSRLPKILLSFGYYFAREFMAFHRCDRIVAASEAVRISTLTWFKLDHRKVSTVYNGVDLSVFKPAAATGMIIRKTHKIKESDKVILFLSHLTKQKGVDVAIRAFAEVRGKKSKVKLMIVGGGNYFLNAKRLVRQMRLEPHVVFSGPLEHHEVPGYINAGNILLFPTLRQEGFSLVLIDAMACAKPIIASNIGGNSEALENGRTGILVEAGNLKEIVKSLENLLDDEKLSQQLGQNALKEVTKRFSEERMIRGIEGVLKAYIK